MAFVASNQPPNAIEAVGFLKSGAHRGGGITRFLGCFRACRDGEWNCLKGERWGEGNSSSTSGKNSIRGEKMIREMHREHIQPHNGTFPQCRWKTQAARRGQGVGCWPCSTNKRSPSKMLRSRGELANIWHFCAKASGPGVMRIQQDVSLQLE